MLVWFDGLGTYRQVVADQVVSSLSGFERILESYWLLLANQLLHLSYSLEIFLIDWAC